jgi:hypothetical protein
MSTVDVLFFEPQHGGSLFSRLVRDLDRYGLPLTREREGDMESRSHDWILGIQPRLSWPRILRSIDGTRRKPNLDMLSVDLCRLNVKYESVEAVQPPCVNCRACQGDSKDRRTSPR